MTATIPPIKRRSTIYCPKILSYSHGVEKRHDFDKDHDYKEETFKHTGNYLILPIVLKF